MDKEGTAYLLHLVPPLGHMRHYLGWTGGDLQTRLKRQAMGSGSRSLAKQRKVGGSWFLVQWWPATRQDVVQQRKSASSRRCPVCS